MWTSLDGHRITVHPDRVVPLAARMKRDRFLWSRLCRNHLGRLRPTALRFIGKMAQDAVLRKTAGNRRLFLTSVESRDYALLTERTESGNRLVSITEVPGRGEYADVQAHTNAPASDGLSQDNVHAQMNIDRYNQNRRLYPTSQGWFVYNGKAQREAVLGTNQLPRYAGSNQPDNQVVHPARGISMVWETDTSPIASAIHQAQIYSADKSAIARHTVLGRDGAANQVSFYNPKTGLWRDPATLFTATGGTTTDPTRGLSMPDMRAMAQRGVDQMRALDAARQASAATPGAKPGMAAAKARVLAMRKAVLGGMPNTPQNRMFAQRIASGLMGKRR